MSNSANLSKLDLSAENRLADFIRNNLDPIVAEWIKFAQTRTPASDNMTPPALQDHIIELLTFIADDLESPQTNAEQFSKSKGLGIADGQFTQSAAEIHADLRLADGFNIDQMVSEYRALRASVVKQWTTSKQVLAATDLDDLTRFNEAIDQAMTESVAQYTKMINQTRNLFLGVLGHDLRNPIGAASMSAQMMARTGGLGAKQTMLAGQIVITMERATHILNDLLELTRSAFGAEIPVAPVSMDMGELAIQLVEEMRAVARGKRIEIDIVGNTEGAWDRPRMGQVFSNLIGNALQYSPADKAISVTVADQGEHVLISVHNQGEPIPLEKQKTIFESMTRGPNNGGEEAGSTNLGLGLFIAHKIVSAHGGAITVASAKDTGTIFTVVLPRAGIATA